ncbi:protein ANKUB1 [Suncus etruscus]|uniref:protein ANKUB1 n=1 Tax=Suncus etruscus TaxID=109475 RepID=UPI00211032AE|nr:protein ANKUB1 [Suncus etruscus]
MRIYIAFEGSFEAFDVSTDETVAAVKLMIKNRFHLPLSEEKQGRQYLELTYAGASLRDSWSLADVGISFCSTIKCFVKEEDQAVLFIFNMVTRQRMVIVEGKALFNDKVSQLRTLVALRCGFPVGVFCLRTSDGLELYDCNFLRDYGLDPGTTLRLDVWDGWKEFLLGCLLGKKLQVQHFLSDERPVLKYQRRVALYIAAFHGHVELTEWALAQGARPHEAVGAHPYRVWCQEALHPDVSKCPVHAAAEAGQLLILRAFVRRSVLALQCKTAAGHTPLALACSHGHGDCARYLLRKMQSTVSLPKVALPMSIYIKIKQWLSRAQSRSRSKRHRPLGATVGATVLVDGFTSPQMTSRSWKQAACKASSQGPGGRLPPLRVQPAAGAKLRPRGGTHLLPPLVAPGSSAAPQQPLQPRRPAVASPTLEKRLGNVRLPPVPLPNLSRPSGPHPCFCRASPASSARACFCAHRGRTVRENALHCLALASTFKEKGWFQQLEIARVLARKSISNVKAHGSLSSQENPLGIIL